MKELYQDYFGFDNKPFNVTPDPDFLNYSEQHKEALAHILYGVTERKGFVLLTGRVGSGKTTICRAFLRELDDQIKTALILNSTMNFQELLATIADEFGLKLPPETTKKQYIDQLNEFVLEQYRQRNNLCVIIDEAQNLSPEVLENLRLLSNLETDKEKLIQTVLVGQPELNSLLNEQGLRQLKQRIAVRCHLSNLSREETREYVLHRLKQANPQKPIKVNKNIFKQLYKITRGNPRTINLLCDRVLMAAYVDESRTLNIDHLLRAGEDLLDEKKLEDADSGSSLTVRRLEKFTSRDSFTNKIFHAIRRGWVAALILAIVIFGFNLLLQSDPSDLTNLFINNSNVGDEPSLTELDETSSVTPVEEDQGLTAVEQKLANPWGVEHARTIDLSMEQSKLHGIARLASLRYGQLTGQKEPLKLTLLEFDEKLTLREIFTDYLPADTLYLENISFKKASQKTLPGLLLWEDDLGQRYLLSVPEEEKIWDPLSGWISPTSDKFESEMLLITNLNFNPNQIYREGQTVEAISHLQILLNAAGDYQLPGINSFGPLTRNAVIDFQNSEGIEVDGRVGPRTVLKLVEVAGAGQITWDELEIRNFFERFGEPDSVTD